MSDAIIHEKKKARRALKDTLPLSLEERAAKSSRICDFIKKTDAFKKASKVGIFTPQAHEPDLRALWKSRSEACVFPKVISKEGLQYYRIPDLKALKAGFAGILEPPDSEEARVDAWSSSDLIIVPGLCFDLQGGRIGSGMGFYDRFLATIPSLKWGAAYERHVSGQPLPQESTDIRLDAVVTEAGVFAVGG